MRYTITTQKQVRAAFWDAMPVNWYIDHYRKNWRQNQYPVDIRTAFVDFVNYLQKDGQISESLAERVTL